MTRLTSAVELMPGWPSVCISGVFGPSPLTAIVRPFVVRLENMAQLLCDVCNAPTTRDEGSVVSPEHFGKLLAKGWGVHESSIRIAMESGLSREHSLAMLTQQHAASQSPWLLCPDCAAQARKVMRHNTKLTLGPGYFEAHDFPRALAGQSGILPMPVTIDLTVGEEVGLYWLDPTAFIFELAAVRPFKLFMRGGLFRSKHGPLMWQLFYVPNPKPEPQPFASVECHIDPCDSQQVGIWRRLANQTHWHLTLLGAGNQVADFFEVENVFRLDDALDTMEQACRGMRVTDFMAAKQEFWERFTMDDLYGIS